MQMKRVLFVTNQIPHYREALFNALARRYDLTVLQASTTSPGSGSGFNQITAPAKRVGPFYYQPGVVRVIWRGEYDVTVVMFDLRWPANMLAVFLKGRRRLLYWGHGYGRSRPGNWLRNYVMRFSDGVVVYASRDVDRIVSNGMPRHKVFVVPNTIHVPNHADGSTSRKDSFLFSGRLQSRKKVDLLIATFAAVCSRLPNGITLSIVGSGSESSALRTLAYRLGVADRVVFYGEITDHERLRALFHRAFAYVSPGPVGLAVLHSFAYGVPVVTSLVDAHGPEFNDLIDQENALLYQTHEALEELLVRLCHDPSLVSRLGHNAYRRYAQDRSLQQMVQAFVTAIEDSHNAPSFR